MSECNDPYHDGMIEELHQQAGKLRSEVAALKAESAEHKRLWERRIDESRGLNARIFAAESELSALKSRLQAAEEREGRLEAALRELHAIVLGESPALLNEDSGGDARLAWEIKELLALPPDPPKAPGQEEA